MALGMSVPGTVGRVRCLGVPRPGSRLGRDPSTSCFETGAVGTPASWATGLVEKVV